MISVILTVRNGERFIKYSLKSVLEQTYENFEVLVIDDASSDKSLEIVKGFKDKRVKIFRNERRRERVFCRNLGIRESKGELLCFLDYDDVWEKNHLEVCLKELKNNDLIYVFPRIFIDKNGKIIRISKKKIPKNVEELIFGGRIGCPPCTCVLKEKVLPYEQKYLMREDWEVFLRYYFKGAKIKVIDSKTVKIREHRGRSSRGEEFLRATLRVYKDYADLIPKKYRPNFYFHLSEVCLRFGKGKGGLSFLLRALREEPSLIFSSLKLLKYLPRNLSFYY